MLGPCSIEPASWSWIVVVIECAGFWFGEMGHRLLKRNVVQCYWLWEYSW
jgi:hypothetical protein